MKLVYVSDTEPGIRRERRGERFVYLNGSRRPIRDAETLARIGSLAIPPAYTDVWICRREDGHLQATGRDARGRKQYRYHADWRVQRDAAKYDRLVEFSERLPALRRQVAADLRRPGIPREKVLAALVRLLEASLIRIGNEEYARSNGSFGLTTLKRRHVRIRGEHMRFSFRGKSGRFHDIQLDDGRLARVLRHCQELPGRTLFQYRDGDGSIQSVRSEDVNAYIRAIAGEEFSAKDFRTWSGTVLAAVLLAREPVPASAGEAKVRVAAAIREVADRLGNTPRVCQACYVHPDVIEAWSAGRLRMPAHARPRASAGLSAAERAIQRLLRRSRPKSAAQPASRSRRSA